MAEICYDDDTLLRYRFETLDPAVVEAVASHLRTCSDCAMRFALASNQLWLSSVES